MAAHRPRLLLPLGISLLAHALFLVPCWLLSWQSRTPSRPGIRLFSRGLKVTVVGQPLVSGGPPAGAQADEEIPIHLPPIVIPTASASDIKAPLPLPGHPGLSGTNHPGGAAGSPGTRQGPGGASGSSLLPVGEQVRRVVYLLDRSMSMGPAGVLDRARQELRASLGALPSGTLFQIIAYNRSTLPVFREAGLVLATPENITRAGLLLDDLSPRGATDHIAAIRRGLVLRPDILFLITDADGLSPTEVQALTRLDQGRTRIHIVELSQCSPPRSGGF